MNLLRLNCNIFIYFYNSFVGQTLSIPITKRLLFLDMALTQYFTKIAQFKFFKDKFVQHFHCFAVILLSVSYEVVHYPFFLRLTKSK